MEEVELDLLKEGYKEQQDKEQKDKEQTEGKEQEGKEDDENTSQNEFQQLFETVDKTAAEWIVPVALEGDLDLSFIRGATCLKKIIFQIPGRISALHNIPIHIVVLHCAHQQIKSVDTFFVDPSKSLLEELYLHNNDIQTVRLSNFKRLVLVCLDDNPLQTITDLPLTLEELYVSHCQLASLYFPPTQLKHLYVFHINVNANRVVLSFLPDSVVDFQHDGTSYELVAEDSTDETQKRKRTQKVKYDAALNEYFDLLSQYEDQIVKNRGKSKPLTCVNCNKVGGTYFVRNQDRYIARCNHKTNPCPLHIEIFTGHFENAYALVARYDKDLLQLKQDIIQARLQSVFLNQGNDDHTETLVKQFEETEQVRRLIVDKVYNAEKDTIQKRELADTVEQIRLQENTLKTMLQEYQTSTPRNILLLTAAMEYQAQVLGPLLQKKRDIMFRKVFVDVYADNQQTVFSRLYQYDVSTDIDEFNTAEPPRVIQYKK